MSVVVGFPDAPLLAPWRRLLYENCTWKVSRHGRLQRRRLMLFTDVLLLGSVERTFVGRPLVPDASVTALVEEQTRDAKVLTLKKRRRKHSRKMRGSRRHVTLLRILDIAAPEAT